MDNLLSSSFAGTRATTTAESGRTACLPRAQQETDGGAAAGVGPVCGLQSKDAG